MFFEKHSKMKYKKLGKTNYSVSAFGFGGYRVDYEVEQHAEALKHAIRNGINLIDTSSNYSDGGSEILIGNILNELSDNKEIERDEIIVVTKAGYIQGENYEIASAKEYNGEPYTGVVKCEEEMWHCIHPDFLDDQISMSLQRMRLNKIDVFLLHNPEYFLSFTNLNDIEELLELYYRRIEKAFRYLETEVEKGRISFYGVSSNTFGINSNYRNFSSLEKMIEIANGIKENNRFAVVQAPLNLLEKGIAAEKNQNENSKTVLELAEENNLGVMVNRPINAMNNNRLCKLANVPVKHNVTKQEVDNGIKELAEEEKLIHEKLLKRIDKNMLLPMRECLSVGIDLSEGLFKFENIDKFIHIKNNMYFSRANFAVEKVKEALKKQKDIDKIENYIKKMTYVVEAVESHFGIEINKSKEFVHGIINEFLDDDKKDLPLSQKALLMVNSLPGISTILVGMRKKEYVDDVLKVMEYEKGKKAKEYFS